MTAKKQYYFLKLFHQTNMREQGHLWRGKILNQGMCMQKACACETHPCTIISSILVQMLFYSQQLNYISKFFFSWQFHAQFLKALCMWEGFKSRWVADPQKREMHEMHTYNIFQLVHFPGKYFMQVQSTNPKIKNRSRL